MDQERTALSRIGRWVGWLVVFALAAVVAFGTVTVVGQVTERPLTRAATVPSAAPPTTVPVVVTDVLLSTPASSITGPLPDVVGLPVRDAQPALERVGAVVVVFDARWERPVGPEWVVCTATETFSGDTATGEVHLAAVPAGDPCP
jgi:hypothetical protein